MVATNQRLSNGIRRQLPELSTESHSYSQLETDSLRVILYLLTFSLDPIFQTHLVPDIWSQIFVMTSPVVALGIFPKKLQVSTRITRRSDAERDSIVMLPSSCEKWMGCWLVLESMLYNV